MRPDDRDRHRGGEGGIPDGLLVGVLAFVLGMTVMVWTATGLAGLFTHGSWPAEVTFRRTPLAMRQLVEAPHDIAAAWPETPDTQLSGYGLFWGLFIGQLMVLLVLTVFVIGTAARWRAGRARRRALALAAAEEPDLLSKDGPREVPRSRGRNGRSGRSARGWNTLRRHTIRHTRRSSTPRRRSRRWSTLRRRRSGRRSRRWNRFP